MAKLKVIIEKDENEIKYIPALRKNTGKSINEIRESILNNDYIVSYNLLDIYDLLEAKQLINSLIRIGGKIHLYEDKRKVNINFLDNLIESYQDTEKYLEETDCQ